MTTAKETSVERVIRLVEELETKAATILMRETTPGGPSRKTLRREIAQALDAVRVGYDRG